MKTKKIRPEEVLEYHSSGRKGKIEVSLTKPCSTQHDLSIAYSPGVAIPCLEIKKNVDEVYNYTAKGNLVAVVSNGTAVLGLGDIGPEAGKPVMEGKGVLFKKFADIDVFDIEINAKKVEDVVKVVLALEPTFGGINLEDIKAPECFYIEKELKEKMNIPVFHDDQHGTAIISTAALINACEVIGKDISKIKIVYNGAGASSISCAKLHMAIGVKKENVIMCDSKGIISKNRTDLNEFKIEFAIETNLKTLADAINGADVFVGLSVANVVTKEMIKSMAKDPIVFALANPDPEITYEDATSVRDDIIMATGRSDYPNQVNNVLGFPFIFRGALDVRAKTINLEMKLAAARAISELAKEDVPDSVLKAYGDEPIKFGRNYIIPKPLDPRVLICVAPAVAKAAIKSGVSRINISDWDEYKNSLEARLARSKPIMQVMYAKAQRIKKRIVFPEGEELKILRACQQILDENLAHPILIGNVEAIKKIASENNLDIVNDIEIIDPKTSKFYETYVNLYFKKRNRKGITLQEAKKILLSPIVFASMMVDEGDADGIIAGLTTHYSDTIRPALQVIGTKNNIKKVSGMYIVVVRKGVYFFADTTVNILPNSEELAEIAILSSETVKRFGHTPKVAMLSFSNFGSTIHEESLKVKRAVEIVKSKRPDIIIDGEMEADTAVVPEILNKEFPFSQLQSPANVLIFPNLDASNASYKLMARLGEAEVIGPILMGIARPVHVLQRGAEVIDIVNMTVICAVEAIEK